MRRVKCSIFFVHITSQHGFNLLEQSSGKGLLAVSARCKLGNSDKPSFWACVVAFCL